MFYNLHLGYTLDVLNNSNTAIVNSSFLMSYFSTLVAIIVVIVIVIVNS